MTRYSTLTDAQLQELFDDLGAELAGGQTGVNGAIIRAEIAQVNSEIARRQVKRDAARISS